MMKNLFCEIFREDFGYKSSNQDDSDSKMPNISIPDLFGKKAIMKERNFHFSKNEIDFDLFEDQLEPRTSNKCHAKFGAKMCDMGERKCFMDLFDPLDIEEEIKPGKGSILPIFESCDDIPSPPTTSATTSSPLTFNLISRKSLPEKTEKCGMFLELHPNIPDERPVSTKNLFSDRLCMGDRDLNMTENSGAIDKFFDQIYEIQSWMDANDFEDDETPHRSETLREGNTKTRIRSVDTPKPKSSHLIIPPPPQSPIIPQNDSSEEDQMRLTVSEEEESEEMVLGISEELKKWKKRKKVNIEISHFFVLRDEDDDEEEDVITETIPPTQQQQKQQRKEQEETDDMSTMECSLLGKRKRTSDDDDESSNSFGERDLLGSPTERYLSPKKRWKKNPRNTMKIHCVKKKKKKREYFDWFGGL